MIGYKPSLPHLDTNMRKAIVDRVLASVGAENIVLFGSRAREAHRPDSDVDLLVVQHSNKPRYKRAVPIYAALVGLPIDVNTDVIVYTPEEIEQWSQARAAFVTTALREGVVLYER